LQGRKLAWVWDEAVWRLSAAKQAKLVDDAHSLAAGVRRQVLEAGTPGRERLAIEVLCVARS
jgi:hypothetical protein